MERAFSVEGVESARLVALNPVVSQVPIPALTAAEAIFTALALSTLQAAEHWSVGAVPVVPLCAAKLAPVLFRVSEFAARVEPPAT